MRHVIIAAIGTSPYFFLPIVFWLTVRESGHHFPRFLRSFLRVLSLFCIVEAVHCVMDFYLQDHRFDIIVDYFRASAAIILAVSLARFRSEWHRMFSQIHPAEGRPHGS